MAALLWIIAGVLVVAGIIGTMVPVLPGSVLVFAGLLMAAWIDGFEKVGWVPLTVLGVLTALTFLADIAATGAGAKKAGASRQAVIGSTIGTVVGMFFGIVGIFVGPFAGAAAGEFLAKRDLVRAGKVGYGTLFGLVLGAATKIALALAMVGVFVTAYLVE
ncbi:MAG: DUF456 family protein [Nitrospirae bacterium]|nr:DUF456 family protein [Nitrospirota bacterium]NTW66235.1 DUF456 family protein [Nitrospirota bacterium]